MERKIVIFYSIPAHGHIRPALNLLKSLAQNYNITVYSTLEFKSLIEQSGFKFVPYKNIENIDLSVGSRPLELSLLLLKFAYENMGRFIDDCFVYKPSLIFFDTLALWGRLVSEILRVPSVSINTFQVCYKFGSKLFLEYMKQFSVKSLSQIKFVRAIHRYKKYIHSSFGVKPGCLLPVLFNRGCLNVFTYPRSMHYDAKSLDDTCFFVGPCSVEDFDQSDKSNLVYISLGTIFNKNMSLYQHLFKKFQNSGLDVVVSCGEFYETLRVYEARYPNVCVRKFVNQSEVLSKARLFVSSGGMNSVCESMAKKVPIIVFPQQGEQRINYKRLKQLGLKQDGTFDVYPLGFDILNIEGFTEKVRRLEHI